MLLIDVTIIEILLQYDSLEFHTDRLKLELRFYYFCICSLLRLSLYIETIKINSNYACVARCSCSRSHTTRVIGRRGYDGDRATADIAALSRYRDQIGRATELNFAIVNLARWASRYLLVGFDEEKEFGRPIVLSPSRGKLLADDTRRLTGTVDKGAAATKD